ncbi:unnamed protein product [Protopolystoma xenopodis]|uniref:Uncharacterized protein n=1 Tax=Protopolystoma xenopodis TaxID=117903 RepID=A0A448WJ27_9PLAT|nr:unnamed protein product [Protopolystoma xenopodis]
MLHPHSARNSRQLRRPSLGEGGTAVSGSLVSMDIGISSGHTSSSSALASPAEARQRVGLAATWSSDSALFDTTPASSDVAASESGGWQTEEQETGQPNVGMCEARTADGSQCGDEGCGVVEMCRNSASKFDVNSYRLFLWQEKEQQRLAKRRTSSLLPNGHLRSLSGRPRPPIRRRGQSPQRLAAMVRAGWSHSTSREPLRNHAGVVGLLLARQRVGLLSVGHSGSAKLVSESSHNVLHHCSSSSDTSHSELAASGVPVPDEGTGPDGDRKSWPSCASLSARYGDGSLGDRPILLRQHRSLYRIRTIRQRCRRDVIPRDEMAVMTDCGALGNQELRGDGEKEEEEEEEGMSGVEKRESEEIQLLLEENASAKRHIETQEPGKLGADGGYKMGLFRIVSHRNCLRKDEEFLNAIISHFKGG